MRPARMFPGIWERKLTLWGRTDGEPAAYAKEQP